MSKFFGKLAAGVGNSVEVTQLSNTVSNLVKECDDEFAKYVAADELSSSEATELERILFEKLLTKYDDRVVSITGKPVPENWNERGEDAPKTNSAVRKRMLQRELENRTSKLYPLFLTSRENMIKTVNEAFKELKAETTASFLEIRGTLPLQPDVLNSLMTQKNEVAMAKLLKNTGGVDNVNKVARLMGDSAETLEMFRLFLLPQENETRQRNMELIEQSKAKELKKIDALICETIRNSLDALAVQQESKHFNESELTYLTGAEKTQFEELLVMKIREKKYDFINL